MTSFEPLLCQACNHVLLDFMAPENLAGGVMLRLCCPNPKCRRRNHVTVIAGAARVTFVDRLPRRLQSLAAR